MKVFFFEPYALAIPHFETALELLETHANSDDEIHWFYCDANLNSCEANYRHSLATCFQCISRRQKGIKAVGNRSKVKTTNFLNLSDAEKQVIDNWNVGFRDISALKAYRFEDIDLGMAVASSLISFHRNPEPDLKASANLVNRFFKASLKVYFSFKRWLQVDRPDLVYLFNGRFSNIRPVIRLCELYNIKYRIHERGSSKTKYSFSESHLPHDFIKFQQLVMDYWRTNSTAKNLKTAETFYQERRAGKEQAWHSFIASQKAGELPKDWDSAKRNIVIFTSSEDEFAAIDDTLKVKLFPTQVEGIRFIADIMSTHGNTAVYVRMHPNLRNVTNSTVTGIYKIAFPNFHVIEPYSTISSYQLIDSSDIVVTFGSTVGIEATFWDKPSVLLGDSFYKDLGATYNPETKEELTALLLNENTPIDKLGAYKYGFYISNYGIDYKFYKAEGLFAGEFKGERIIAPRWIETFLKKKPLSLVINFISRIHADKF